MSDTSPYSPATPLCHVMRSLPGLDNAELDFIRSVIGKIQAVREFYEFPSDGPPNNP